jgi:predicted permease
MFQDCAFSVRLLAKSPLFTISVIASLALGIGLNIAAFSVVDSLLLKPLPAVQDQDRLAFLYGKIDGDPNLQPISVPDSRDIREQSRSFAAIAGYQFIQAGLSFEGGTGAPEQVIGEMVTANYFRVLGVEPALGRTFLDEEDRAPGASPVVVISHDLWEKRFAADPAIIGRRILLNRHPYTVVGVTPAGFKGTSLFYADQLWVPTMMYRQVFMMPDLFDLRKGKILQLVGKLKEGEPLERAEAELKGIGARLAATYPEDNKGQSIIAVPLREDVLPSSRKGQYVRSATLLMAIVGALLLITCANVASLLLARALVRGREMAIRAAVGAAPARLARQLLTESLTLAVLGGAVSLLVARWSWDLFASFRPPLLAAIDFRLNGRVLLFALAATLVTGLLFGLLPVLKAARPDLASMLREHASSRQAKGRHLPFGDVLVAFQVGLCCVSLACAGLFFASLRAAQRIDPGFRAEQVAMVSFDLRAGGYEEAAARAFQQQVLDRVRALPAVQSAEIGENRLLGGFRMFRKISLKGAAPGPGEDGITAGSSIVGPHYFSAVGIPLVAGRAFGEEDRPGSPAVAIVNRVVAEKLWPGRNPVGETAILNDEEDDNIPVQIVGVAGDSKLLSLSEKPMPFLYLPLSQRPSPRSTLHVRTDQDPGALLKDLRAEVQALDRDLPLDAKSGPEVLAQALWLPRLSAAFFAVLGVISLILSAMGVYGVTAYSINRRRFEIGVRMALGAQRATIVRWILKAGLIVIGAGALAGALMALALSRWVASLLYAAQNGWPLVLLSAGILLATGLLANLVPALRAVAGGPWRELRQG